MLLARSRWGFFAHLGGLALLLALGGACGDAGQPAGPGATQGGSSGKGGTDGGGGDSGPSPVDPSACPTTLDELYTQVLLPGCAGAGCHSAAEHVSGLDLETRGMLETELLGVASSQCAGETRVVPGDPSASLLVTKLDGTSSCGELMPLGLPALSADTVACVASVVGQLTLSGCETCGGAACLDLTGDDLNCGACGAACPAGASCVDSACSCPGGLEACGSSCVDTLSDGDHCGGCGAGCGSAFCLDGACAADCGSLTACGNSCIDTQNDDRNCGGCGVVCGAGTACNGGACTCGSTAVSFAKDVQPIFTAGCIAKGCHDSAGGGAGGGGRPGGGGNTMTSSLDLTSGNAYASLMATSSRCGDVVVPGDAEGSLLIGKLTGDQLCGGQTMPKGDDPLPQASLDTIAQWICQGALDN